MSQFRTSKKGLEVEMRDKDDHDVTSNPKQLELTSKSQRT